MLQCRVWAQTVGSAGLRGYLAVCNPACTMP
jgi:hypothetical protein